jgi:hypothetical protein
MNKPVVWVAKQDLLDMQANAIIGVKDWSLTVGLVEQKGDVPLYTILPEQPTKIFGPNLEELLNGAGFYRKKESVKLTDNEIDAGLLSTNYVGRTASAWRDGVEWAEKNKRLNEKLTWSKEECAVFRKKEWVGLTDEEKQKAYLKIDTWGNCVNFIEETLRGKNK